MFTGDVATQNVALASFPCRREIRGFYCDTGLPPMGGTTVMKVPF